MPKFTFIYRGGNPPRDGRAHMTRWRAWRDGLGDAYVYPGMPFSRAVTVSSEGVSEAGEGMTLSGFSVVEVDDIEVAQRMAASCPHLDLGGDIIVAEGLDMEM